MDGRARVLSGGFSSPSHWPPDDPPGRSELTIRTRGLARPQSDGRPHHRGENSPDSLGGLKTGVKIAWKDGFRRHREQPAVGFG